MQTPMMVKRDNGAFQWPRRQCVDQYIPAEQALTEVERLVESLGAHPRLTDALIRIQQAREAVADWAEETGNVKPE